MSPQMKNPDIRKWQNIAISYAVIKIHDYLGTHNPYESRKQADEGVRKTWFRLQPSKPLATGRKSCVNLINNMISDRNKVCFVIDLNDARK